MHSVVNHHPSAFSAKILASSAVKSHHTNQISVSIRVIRGKTTSISAFICETKFSEARSARDTLHNKKGHSFEQPFFVITYRS